MSVHQSTQLPRPDVAARRPARGARRWFATWSCHWLFYLALAAVTVGVVAGGTASAVFALPLAGAVGAWYGYWNVYAAERLTRSGSARAWYVAGGAVGWLGLLAVDRGYGIAGIVMFAQLFGYLTRRAALAVLVVVVAVHAAAGGVAGTLGGPLVWRGVQWDDTVGAVVTMALVALCVYLDRQVAAARAELAAAERRAGALGERTRLAGDLHDTLTQNLSSMVMQLEAAQEAYRAGDPGTAANLDQALATARGGLADVRGLVWDLRPEALSDETLDRALTRMTERFAGESGVDAHAVVTGVYRRLPPRTEATVLRVAEEALANVRKHAAASSLTVTLSYIDDVVALDVCDDGSGFDPSAVPGPRRDGGLGLLSMRERVEAVGGTLTVESGPGQGTSVAVQLPAELTP